MRHERFLEPISDANPCGDDLDEIGDEDYLNYLLPASDRLPERFYEPKTGALFDRGSLDLKSELKAIDSLLERSRDLRLICLEARFQAFAGSIVGVADCVLAIDALLEKFFEHVHPKPLDEEDPVRQSLIGALDDRPRIVLPLHYAPMLRDRRHGVITFRHHAIASGQVEARDDEQAPSLSDIEGALSSEDNLPSVTAITEGCKAALTAMRRIRGLFEERAGYDNLPDFGSLQEFFADLVKLMETARPELGGAQASGEEAAEGATEAAGGEDGTAAPAGVPAEAQPAIAATRISSHGEALAALMAAESYFGRHEPSAPALLLVHQARRLVGKPLVEAIEMLLPEAADRAVIRFDRGLGFQISMNHMRSLSSDAAHNIPSLEEEQAEQSFEVSTRAGATALLTGVEEHFRRAEPSSPVPMLLAKARSYLNRDFTTILNDIVGKESE